MSFAEILYNLFIGPLELFFQVIFAIADRHVSNPAYAIIILSLAMNLLVLPLYRRADAIQAEEREREKKISPWVKHIKKAFKGDERFMMLQAYYKEVGYKPTDSLKGSVSLLLEIPFFIAAYHFLSHLGALKGISFGPLKDLGTPDGLIVMDSFSINLLPILMTLINVVSAMLYMKGLPLKNKIQMYGIAAIFLILLYNSPSGLVFYWTLNNVFSLIKNVFYKLTNPEKILRILCSIAGMVLFVIIVFVHPMPSTRTQIIAIVLVLCMQIPIIPKRRSVGLDRVDEKDASKVFYASTIFLTLLTGLLIPTTVIGDSTDEFLGVIDYYSPVWYIVAAVVMATGTFIIWFGVFYRLSSLEGRKIFSVIMAIIAVAAAVDYMFFGKNYGNFSSNFVFDETPRITGNDILFNVAILFIASIFVAVIYLKKIGIVKAISLAMCLSVTTMVGLNVISIDKNLEKSSALIKAVIESETEINLSRDGKNVIVMMMDRQIGHFIPFIMHERPDLKKSFDGFTNYHNTFSYGIFTNTGSPGLYGGYDYTPEAINERTDVKLEDKHNEAIKLMPRMFLDEGFDVTVLDPTYAGYKWVPDISIYDDMPEVHVGVTKGRFSLEKYGYEASDKTDIEQRKRNIFLYSIFKISPAVFQPTIYTKGSYNKPVDEKLLGQQENIDMTHSRGMNKLFLNSYAVLCHLRDNTRINKGNNNTFLMMSNDLPHEPTLLQEPEFEPAEFVDNSSIGDSYTRKRDDKGNELILENEIQLKHYHSNMATMIKLGEWLDYLKAEDVYDNTRVIIVSDHGRDINDNVLPPIKYKDDNNDKEEYMDPSYFNSVLLVKDFDSEGFRTNEDLISNADTPFIATEGIIQNAVNPYTSKRLRRLKEDGEPQLIYSFDYSTEKNNGTVFLPSNWFTVKESIYDSDNWKYAGYH